MQRFTYLLLHEHASNGCVVLCLVASHRNCALLCLSVCLQAQRAEVDCGSLLDELQQLIQAKADVAQQRADLDRYVAPGPALTVCCHALNAMH